MLVFLFLLGLVPVALYSSDDPQMEPRQTNCPSLWTSFDGRCYKYIGTQATWARAELQCVSQGGNLVSIHSRAEEDFVKLLIKLSDPAEGITWIGLSDIYEQGRWVWSDGCAAKYFFWKQGEPNNQGGNEHCVFNNWSGKWNDTPCSLTLPSVCASRTTCLKLRCYVFTCCVNMITIKTQM
ncbi:Lactose-binding lectin l-2 [Dissostichus eleginoides]|uniref:Lactose-binding lectin l-2 n=1 Tax=Dissostichus eleginoides TaxID=100907 RepID=A0AAD9EVB1_DISEL|nr:Lactose-binding lectin l-2 [Dissostichus eleginoides]